MIILEAVEIDGFSDKKINFNSFFKKINSANLLIRSLPVIDAQMARFQGFIFLLR